MAGGILSIERAGPLGSFRRRLLIDSIPIMTTARDVVRALELSDGDHVSEGELRKSIAAEEPHWAQQRALRLLNHRERSVAELARRLQEDGYSPKTVGHVVSRLEELELVDDARFASVLIRTKVAAGWGRSRINRALRTAGVADDTIEAALAEEYPDDDMVRMRELAARATVRTPKDADRLVAKLIRRGYDASLARQVAEEVRTDVPED